MDEKDLAKFADALGTLKVYQDSFPGRWTASHAVIYLQTGGDIREHFFQWFYRADHPCRFLTKTMGDAQEYYILCREKYSDVVTELSLGVICSGGFLYASSECDMVSRVVPGASAVYLTPFFLIRLWWHPSLGTWCVYYL